MLYKEKNINIIFVVLDLYKNKYVKASEIRK